MEKITKEWLTEQGACSEGVSWFLAQKEVDAVKTLKKLIKEKQLDWANLMWWLENGETRRRK